MFENYHKLIRCYAVIVLCVNCVESNFSVPVIIWGSPNQNLTRPALQHLNGTEFITILNQLIRNDTTVLVLLQKQLSVEDFGTNLNTVFENESKYGNIIYFPSVEAPAEYLKNISTKQLRVAEFENRFADCKSSHFADKFLSIEIDIFSPNQISSVLAKFKNHLKNTLFIYTADGPRMNLKRVARHKQRKLLQTPESIISHQDDKVMLYCESILYKLKDNNETSVKDVAFSSAETEDKTGITLTGTAGDVTILMIFKNSQAYWSLYRINVTENSITHGTWTKPHVTAPINMSYNCYEIIASRKGFVIKFINIQIQANFKLTDFKAFTESYSCAKFATGPIFMVFFIVFKLVTIMFIGILAMMSINTNDKFDDARKIKFNFETAE